MAQIFIANPTLQHRDLHVRLPKSKQTRILRIRALGQEMFPDQLEGELLQSVISQIEQAGAVPADDPGAIRNRFSLLYTVSNNRERPISKEAIEEGVEQDEEVRQTLAGDMLEKSGVAAFNNAQKVGAREISMEIIETNDQAPVSGGVDVEVVVGKKRNVRGGRAESKKR